MNQVSVHHIEFCHYNFIYKIKWVINGKETHNFSTMGKRIGNPPTDRQKAIELVEAYERGDIVVEYLEGKIDRFQAIRRLQALQFLGPKNPTSHLATVLEYAAGLRI